MDLNIKSAGQVKVVEIAGEIDGKTGPEAQEQILPLVEPDSKIILDMSGVNYMSSAGLRVLLSLYRQASASGGKVVLVGLQEEIEDTMSATGFLRFFSTYDTIDAGLVALE